ncbi:shikimate kinase [Phenylobacterium sp. LjRoot225]|uniref:AAA family ATPase n=1 Tax=Phenylobacterium sp. LjRoot225 TaxID=3342285 RepID=UPI003ECDC263
MQLIFVFGQPASGKFTVGRELAAITGLPLFHNHLVVDAVGAVFPFGTEPFVCLREEIWLRVIGEAARAGRSLIFTFAPESTVDPAFPLRLRELVEGAGGAVLFVALDVSLDQQEQRLVDPSRAQFGKLRSIEMLRSLRDDFTRCMRDMPAPDLAIDTAVLTPREAAEQIASHVRWPAARPEDGPPAASPP